MTPQPFAIGWGVNFLSLCNQNEDASSTSTAKKCKNRVLGCKNMGINDSVFE